MDARLPRWQDRIRNPLTLAAFSCTEPHLLGYLAVHVEAELAAAGFTDVASRANTETHTTFVGRRPP